MGADGHYDYCRCRSCWSPERQAMVRERALLRSMTFHERKAYRIRRSVLSVQASPNGETK